jgi:hypothetical protein
MCSVEIEGKGVASNATASIGIRAVANISVTILSSQRDLCPVLVVVSYSIHLALFCVKQLMWKMKGQRAVKRF